MSYEEKIPFCRHSFDQEELAAVEEALKGDLLTRGPRTRVFEEACEARLHASNAIACSSGSAALEIALRGLGIGPGDEVIVPTLTWVATAMAVVRVGATPVFCDIDPDRHHLTADTVDAMWSERTRAVIGVDMAGQPCDVFELRRMVDIRGAVLVEDAAHSFGAAHADRTPVGRDESAHAICFSFQPSKTITTAEGGLVTCSDDVLAERLRRIRSGGVTRDFEAARGPWDYLATEIGSNSQLTELQASLGLVQIDRLDSILAARSEAFDAMTHALMPLQGELELPHHPVGSSHNLYIVLLAGDSPTSAPRNTVIEHMQARGVEVRVHYPLLHRQPVFQYEERDEFPVARRYERRALTLPLFPGITPEEIERVVQTLTGALDALPAERRAGGSAA